MGKLAGRFRRFPLLLKFLDVRSSLSVQVHPSDRQTDYLPPGETGKTEAWVVLEAAPQAASTRASSRALGKRTAAGNRQQDRRGPSPDFSPKSATASSFLRGQFMRWRRGRF